MCYLLIIICLDPIASELPRKKDGKAKEEKQGREVREAEFHLCVRSAEPLWDQASQANMQEYSFFHTEEFNEESPQHNYVGFENPSWHFQDGEIIFPIIDYSFLEGNFRSMNLAKTSHLR